MLDSIVATARRSSYEPHKVISLSRFSHKCQLCVPIQLQHLHFYHFESNRKVHDGIFRSFLCCFSSSQPVWRFRSAHLDLPTFRCVSWANSTKLNGWLGRKCRRPFLAFVYLLFFAFLLTSSHPLIVSAAVNYWLHSRTHRLQIENGSCNLTLYLFLRIVRVGLDGCDRGASILFSTKFSIFSTIAFVWVGNAVSLISLANLFVLCAIQMIFVA